jgi:ribosomal protein L40E
MPKSRDGGLVLMPPKISIVPIGAMLIFVSLTLMPVHVGAQTYSVSFTVTGLPAGVRAQYYLDGVVNGTIATGETKTLDLFSGTMHTLSVDLNLDGGNGTRYQCRDNIWSVGGEGPHNFIYKTQYYFEVVSPYGSPSGSDWYDEGATVQARLAVNMTVGPEGTRYVFVRWERDASGQGIASDPLVMNSPKRAVAQWKTQYGLRISYDPVGVFSPLTLWFDADSTAEFVAPEGTNGTDARQVFVEWAGDYSGTTLGGSIRMDGPKSVTAKYKAQYKLSVVFDPPETAQRIVLSNVTWYDAGQSAALGPVPQTIPIPESPAERFAWFSWNIDNMTQPGTSVQILMNSPHSVRLIYQRQYYLLVISSLGEPTGTGWYVSGQKAKFGVAYNGSELLVKHSLVGWRLNSSNVIDTVPPTVTEVTMDRPYVIEAQWATDYTPMWVFILALVSAVAVFAGVLFIILKRPGSLGRLRLSLGSSLGRRKIAAPAATAQVSLVLCQKCGAGIPSTAAICQACGALQMRGQAASVPEVEKIDNRVYDYIVKRGGEISLSQASKDLGFSVEELRLSTERLRRKGRLA